MKTSLIFLLGLGMGTVLGILVAPDAGRITRRRIREEADKMVDRALAKKRLKDANINVNGSSTALSDEPAVTTIIAEERYTL